MIRQPSYQHEIHQQRMSMYPGPPHPNSRLVMTAPRPRLRRLLSDDEASPTNSTGNNPDEVIIHKNFFAQPSVVQNDIFRQDQHHQNRVMTVANNYYDNQYQIYQQPQPHPNHPTHRSLLNILPKRRPDRGTCSKVKRTGNGQYCDLSAEISLEISHLTPTKTPSNTPGKTPSKGMMAQLSRDLFRAKTSAPMTDNRTMDIQLTQTLSMSSSDGGSSPRVFPFMPQQPTVTHQPIEAATKNVPMNPKTQPKKLKVCTSFIGGLSTRKELKKCLTPSRKNFGSHIKHHQARTSPAAQVVLSIPYNGVNDYRMTSTEHDPSLFQVELPAKKEIIVHSKICALMDGYTAIHRDFNFAMLSGVSHSALEKEYERSTDEKPMIAGSCHRDVVQKLLTCANDIVVEGFFREYTDEENDKESERMEACILSSESLRQIIVCFRGSTSNQAKPLVKSSLFGKQASCILDEEQKVPILTTFRTAYFGTSLEKTVFALLANLETRKPFFDVVMTGHSFGAAMATIASLRYASSNSQMRVSCHVFGSPRIGGEEWRQLIHSVPNLRIYRVENGLDPYVLLPSGNEWIHCGHAIQMGDGSEFKARRFDRDRSATTSKNHNLLGFVQAKVGMAQGSSQGKVDHEIQSYDEKLTSSGDKWFTDFCEVKGKGIRANNERRTLA